MKKITNTYRKETTITLTLTKPAAGFSSFQKTQVDLPYQESLTVNEEEIGDEMQNLYKKGYITIEDCTPKKVSATSKIEVVAPVVTPIITPVITVPSVTIAEKADQEVSAVEFKSSRRHRKETDK